MTDYDFGPGHPAADDEEALLSVSALTKHFPVRGGSLVRRSVGVVRAVDGVAFSVRRGTTLGLVGESGCGKSTTGRLIARLQEPTSGSARFEGREIARLSNRELRPLRTQIQMIFQDPYSSLNPRHSVGSIIGAPLLIHRVGPRDGVRREVQSLMERVGLNPEHVNRYPNEFSGGQRQRVGIARAIALRPKLIVCDEPVSALDVSVQAQVVSLLEDLQDEFGLTYVFVAHDLAVVRHISDRVAVMYLGKIMELADTDALYRHPRHPYTRALMSAVPSPRPPRRDSVRRGTLLVGEMPNPSNPPPGCVFHTRCPKFRDTLDEAAQNRCRTEVPRLESLGSGRFAACHYPEGEQ